MVDIWDKFQNSGRIEDYLAYKQESLGNIYTYDIIKNQGYSDLPNIVG